MPEVIAPAPTPPSTDDPDDFDARADAFVAWQAAELAPKANLIAAQVSNDAAASSNAAAASQLAAQAAVATTSYAATSNSSLNVGTGVKNVTLVEANKGFGNGDRVTLMRRANRSVRMSGLVSAANMGAKTMTVTVDVSTAAGGPYTDWFVILGNLESVGAITDVADVWGATIDDQAVTPKKLLDAEVSQAVAEAATITLNGNAGKNFHFNVSAARTLANPVNFKPGQSGRIRVNKTAGSLAFGAMWDFPLGAPDLPNGVNVIAYFVHDASSIEANVMAELS